MTREADTAVPDSGLQLSPQERRSLNPVHPRTPKSRTRAAGQQIEQSGKKNPGTDQQLKKEFRSISRQSPLQTASFNKNPETRSAVSRSPAFFWQRVP